LTKIPIALHKLSFNCRSSGGRIGKMCLAIPARILRIEGNLALVDMAGVKREADIRMVKDLKVGEYVLIHAGFAIEKMRKKDAQETLKLFEEMT
jgi:hydrogenase expression/formation protein HypC